MDRLMLYGMIFGPNYYFHKGSAVVTGKWIEEKWVEEEHELVFSCLSKSGSQNLWLPFLPKTGLKIFHPKGYSGTFEKAKAHCDAQRALARLGLAPLILAEIELVVTFLSPSHSLEPWNCYGATMERIFNGGAFQIMENLKRFGCKLPDNVADLLVPYGVEALTFRDYRTLCGLFDGDDDRVMEAINELDAKLPERFKGLPDLLTPANIVLDHRGEFKVIDFDLCNV